MGWRHSELTSQPLQLLASHLCVRLRHQEPNFFSELRDKAPDGLGVAVQSFRGPSAYVLPCPIQSKVLEQGQSTKTEVEVLPHKPTNWQSS